MSIDLDGHERRELRRKSRAATLEALRSLGGREQRGAIVARAVADGGFSPRELAARPPEAAQGKYPRLIDHQLSWALTDLKRDGLVENPSRSVWQLAGAALEDPQPATEEPIAADRLSALRRMTYRDYLRTPEWRHTRAKALVRAGYSCSLDVTHTDDLDVHHRTYERLGAELARDLTVLCRTCHDLHHAEHGRPRRSSARRPSTGPPAGERGGRSVVAKGGERSRPSLLHRLLAR